MHTPDNSDGPAVNCPGYDRDTACEDYPNGSCEACDEAEDDRRVEHLQRFVASMRPLNVKVSRPFKPNPYPNGPR